MQLGSLQLGQFLQRTLLVATLLSNISFCSSGVNLLKASWSIKFFFSSVVFSPSLFSFCSPSGFCSEGFPSFSLFSSGFSFLESDSGLAVVTCFFVGGFFLNLLKNEIMSIFFYFFYFWIFFVFISILLRKDFKLIIIFLIY